MPNDADLEDAAGSQDADTVGARGADTADAALDVQDDATALVADATDDPADVPGPADSAESGGAADLGGAPDTAAAPDVPTATDAQAGKDGNDGLDGASAQDAGDAAGPDLAPPPIKPQDPTQLPKVAFADITATFGVDPAKVHGACVGIGDFDGNGHDDFLVIEVDKTKATIHAVLLGGATVKHVYTPFDTTMLLPSTGCSVVDLDSDGKLDLLAGGHAGAAFYAGDGKGSFVDHTDKWLPYIMDFATLTLAPVDLDGDGDLDLFVGAGVTPMTSDGGGPGCGSLNCGYQDSDFICSMMMPFPEAPASLQDRVLIQGAKLPLVDQTKAWGVPPGGMWSNAQPLDVDADGKMDVLVGDDFGAHRLLRNVGGKFAAYSTDIGFHSYGHGMGWGVGDLNGDGLADLIMADAGPNPLFLQGKAPAGMPVGFEDAGGPWGLWSPTWMASTWSPLIADFDQDGYDDVMMGVSISTTNPDEFPNVAAGCAGTAAKPYDGYPNPDVLFLSAGSASSWQAFQFPSGPYSHFAMVAQATIDLDGDGDLDLVQTRPNAKMTSLVRVVRNDLPNKGKSLFVHVKGKPGNLDALGTVITAKVGGALRTRYLVGSGGTGGTRSRVAHFGLGNAASAKDVTIRWPNGKVTKLGELQAGTHTSATWPVQCM
ncbi:MAG: VCBS repeat-containing protein [Deltaproteobacteria bacterium]|nr:VCBS repeat-containing protein [Deltaproteobacteria bacterium]